MLVLCNKETRNTMERIYCDNAATTKLAPGVIHALNAVHTCDFTGNASATYQEGRVTREIIDRMRDHVAQLLGGHFSEVMFTSGGTESDNVAVIGSYLARRKEGRSNVVVSAVEHHAVLDAAKWLATFFGVDVRVARVDGQGKVDLNHLESLVNSQTAVVSVQHANNELGTIQPVREVSKLAQAAGAWFHCDAVQTPLSVPFCVDDIGADLVTISSHKIHGPKGIGALWHRVPFEPLQVGGAQERGIRGGTENVYGIVGFGTAAMLASEDRYSDRPRAQILKVVSDFLRSELRHQPNVVINTPDQGAMASHVHVSILGRQTEDILLALDRQCISASGGAACASGAVEPSHVLLATGMSKAGRDGALRLSVGPDNTIEEMRYVAGVIGALAMHG